MTFKLTRGETFSLALEAFEITAGETLTGATCSGVLKVASNGGSPGDSVAPVATFAVATSAAVVPGGGPGWILTLTPAQTAALVAVLHVTDMKVTLAGGFVEIVDLHRVMVLERVTQ